MKAGSNGDVWTVQILQIILTVQVVQIMQIMQMTRSMSLPNGYQRHIAVNGDVWLSGTSGFINALSDVSVDEINQLASQRDGVRVRIEIFTVRFCRKGYFLCEDNVAGLLPKDDNAGS